MSKQCVRCTHDIEPERISILPDTDYCISCAKAVQPKRVKGAMIYSHKTHPELQIMSAEYFENEWKHYTSEFGHGSGVHKMSPREAGTA